MSDVTATDRETAINVLASARADDIWRTDKAIELLERIAVALAEERAKARAETMDFVLDQISKGATFGRFEVAE